MDSKPNRWGFIAEQVLAALRETYVKNPEDVAYQFSKKIADQVIETRYQTENEIVKEGAAISLYKGVEKLLTRVLKK